MKHKDVLIEGSNYELSLTKIVGKKIKEITGYITTEFGEPTFSMTGIEFEDGTKLICDGEHDCAYIETYNKSPKGFDKKLEEINKTDPDYKDYEKGE